MQGPLRDSSRSDNKISNMRSSLEEGHIVTMSKFIEELNFTAAQSRFARHACRKGILQDDQRSLLDSFTRTLYSTHSTIRYWWLFCVALLAAISLGLVSSAARGHENEPAFQKLATPLPTDDRNRVEVIEFFWYGCPHCYQLETTVQAWKQNLPTHVSFRQEHVIWDGRRETRGHARLFATLRAMDLLAQHQHAVFEAIHSKKLTLQDERTAFEWASKRGIDRAKFEATYKSFGVESQLSRAKKLTDDYRIDGVPKFIVNGKYVTSPHQAGNEKKMFDLIDTLVQEERNAKR